MGNTCGSEELKSAYETAGLFAGCSLALIISLIITIYARNMLKNPGKEQYMNNVFPLYRYIFRVLTPLDWERLSTSCRLMTLEIV